jgi:hypothetical protein
MVGNLGGPGNPFARQTAQLRKVLVESARDDDVKDVAAALLFRAKSGDVAAAKLWLSYVVGKPAETVNPDTLDREEWQAFLDNMIKDPEELERLRCGMPVMAAAHLARYFVPCHAEKFRDFVAERLCAAEEKEQATEKQSCAGREQRSAEKRRSAVSEQRSAAKVARTCAEGQGGPSNRVTENREPRTENGKERSAAAPSRKVRGRNGYKVHRPAVAQAARPGDPRRARGQAPMTNGENGRPRAGKELTEHERTSAIGKILKALGRTGQPDGRRDGPRYHR